MFHEACMNCGKVLDDDAQIYCSDECSYLDGASPSISSSSSALSSPHIDYAMGGEVPALVPSALGSALSSYKGSNRYSVSSSSASSISWSGLTDEEDNISVGVQDESSNYLGSSDAQSSIYEGSTKSSSLIHVPKSSRSSALSYARRPSTTNHRSTIPQLHRRTSSSSSGFGEGIPQSAPSVRSPNVDNYLTVGCDFKGEHDHYFSEADQEQEHATVSPKSKRSRNRASLPACFSLLQMSSPQRPSPISPSIKSHASPPTPKMTLAASPAAIASKAKSLMSVSTSSTLAAAVEATPRGRQRVAGTSRSSRRSQQSRSRSPSRNPSRPPQLNLQPERRGRLDSRSSVEKVFDWSSVAIRGRPAVRRNSSPLPKMLLSKNDFDDSTSVVSGSERTRTRARGRIAVDELEGSGFTVEAPGFGIGRSGLLHRKRESTGRGTLGLRS
jgi:hypothetical protein